MSNGFAPQRLGQIRLDEHSARALEEDAVDDLCLPILERGVMNGTSFDSTLRFEKVGKLGALVFTTSIGLVLFDSNAMLRLHACSKVLVSTKCPRLLREKSDLVVIGSFVKMGAIVLKTVDGFD